MNKFLVLLFSMLLVVGMAGNVDAAPILNRTDLGLLLGGNAIDENFEDFLGDTFINTFELVGATLDSTTHIGSYGPNLVPGGVAFQPGPALGTPGIPLQIQWNAKDYIGLPSQSIVANDSQTIIVDFASSVTPVQAFGIDLLTYGWDSGGLGIVRVYGYGSAGPLMYTSTTPIPLSTVPFFFGYEDMNGIGRVEIEMSGDTFLDYYSPNIDNLTFGTAVPLPGAMWLLGSGLVCLVGVRRRFKNK